MQFYQNPILLSNQPINLGSRILPTINLHTCLDFRGAYRFGGLDLGNTFDSRYGREIRFDLTVSRPEQGQVDRQCPGARRSQRVRRSVSYELASVYDNDSITGCLHLAQDMGREDNRFFVADLFDDRSDFHDLIGIETRGGFIQDKDFWIAHHCMSQPHPLLIAL